ncbi:unnamed protein product [Sphagnum jensenii]|uniref:Phosphorylated adapter RNA export protein n=1 Tax=Sphagnum jensenii TaxID=128206 RepID=A0ABP1C261_9BRYO
MDPDSVLAAINEHDPLDYDISLGDDDIEEGELQAGFRAMELEDGEVPEDHEISKGDCSPFSIGDSEKQSNNVTSEGNVQSEVKLQTCHQDVADERFVEELKSSGSSKKKHKRKRRNHPNKKINLDRFVVETCKYLQEPKYPLMREAVERLGVDVIQDLVQEVDVIEKCGGQMTNDGSRRRTPGGVLWNILSNRVGPVIYKEIMTRGNERVKQRLKEKFKKDNLKRERPVLTQEVVNNGKRHKTGLNGVSPPIKDTMWASRLTRTHSADPNLPNSFKPIDELRKPIEAQKAWAEGIRVKERIETAVEEDFDAENQLTIPGNHSISNIKERLRMPVTYSDLVEDDREINGNPVNEKFCSEEDEVLH